VVSGVALGLAFAARYYYTLAGVVILIDFIVTYGKAWRPALRPALIVGVVAFVAAGLGDLPLWDPLCFVAAVGARWLFDTGLDFACTRLPQLSAWRIPLASAATPRPHDLALVEVCYLRGQRPLTRGMAYRLVDQCRTLAIKHCEGERRGIEL
jgi:hypothetical protein